MMSGRPGREPFKFLPDESRGLPPPKLNDPRLVYTGFLGYCAGLLNNALKGRPVLKAVFKIPFYIFCLDLCITGMRKR
ncbi:NADH dehydrogenase [ubiquinone] 1 subunit C2-like protein [Cricetulus griseus]|nr:NADH dehydrogenase [ubiquinone] 1 subunit C2-like protein [Cricetulus griseus]